MTNRRSDAGSADRWSGLGRLLVLQILALGLLTLSCVRERPATEAGMKLRIGVASINVSTPLIIARERGYFPDAGLEVEFRSYPSGRMALGGLFAGEVDIATVAETPVVFNSFFRNDFAVIATFTSSYDDCKVIARGDAGIRVPTDLKGKRVGTAFKTSSHFFSSVYLIEHGIDAGAVTMVDLSPAVMTAALQSGAVDAVVIFEPYAGQVERALPGLVFRLPKSELYRETFNLATMRAFAGENPEALKKLLLAIDRAVHFISRNRDESIALTAKNLKVDAGSVRAVWDDFAFSLSLDQALLTTMEDQARWAIGNRLVESAQMPNYLEFIDTAALQAVRPARMTIVKER